MFHRGKLRYLHDTHDSQLRRYVNYHVQDPSMREDLVQETWLKLLLYGGHTSLNGHTLPWMLRVLRNMAVNHHRSQSRLVYDVPELPYTSSIDASMEDDQAFTSVMHALSHCPLDQQKAVLMVDYAGYSIPQACSRLHVTSSALRSRLTRARRLIRRMVGQLPVLSRVVLPPEYMPTGVSREGHEVHEAYRLTHVVSTHVVYECIRHESVSTWRLSMAQDCPRLHSESRVRMSR